MVLCLCHAINDHTVRQLVAEGAKSVEDVASACRAGTDCGGCRSQLAEVVKEATAACRGDCPDCPSRTGLVLSAA